MTTPNRQSGLRWRVARRRAFAFVVVLFLVLIIATVTASFSMRASAAYRLTRSRAAGWQMYYAARGAIEQAKATLWQQFVGAKGTTGIAAVPEPANYQVGGADVCITFEDESGKFPVNAFTLPDEGKRKDYEAVLARLFEILSAPAAAGLAASAMDYIDKDTDGMKERDALNDAIFDVSQLLSAPGFESKFLYNSMREGRPPAVRVLSPWHTNPINVNSASPEVLKAFSPRLTDADLRAIIAARAEAPFKSMEDVVTRSKISGEGLAELGKYAGFSTDTITLRAEAKLGGSVRRIEAVVWLESTAGHTLYMREGWQ